MKEDFIVKVEPAEGCNPDFAPRKDLTDGIQCSGYVIITFDEDSDPKVTAIDRVSNLDIAHAICKTPVLQEAFAIAEGLMKAHKIHEESERSKKLRELIGSGLFEEGEDEDNG